MYVLLLFKLANLFIATMYRLCLIGSKLGFVVCFINDGRIGVYTELDIRGDYTMGNIVQVKWGKEFYPARVIFLGKFGGRGG